MNHHYEVRVAPGHPLAVVCDDEDEARAAAVRWSTKLSREVVVEVFDPTADRIDGGHGAMVLVAVYDDGVAV